MQALKYIEDKFEFLPLRVKIELFLFPLLIFGVLIYFIFDEQTIKNKNFVSKKIVDTKVIKMKESIVDVLKEIEKYSFKNKIDLHLLRKGDKNIKLEIFSSLEKRVLFLKYIEELNSFSKIKNFELLEDSLVLEIEFEKFYKKENYILNKEFLHLEVKKETKRFILQAIVDDKALINNRWLKVDDKIDSFILKEIENSKIILENQFDKLTLKLYKNENL